MGKNTPFQIRTVDPFSAFHSDNVNRLTRIVSMGKNCIVQSRPISLSFIDNSHILFGKGDVIKDDVYIEFTEDIQIDLNDIDFYVMPDNGLMDELGYYYILVDYNYVIKKDPNTAKIKLIRPSQRKKLYDTDKYMLVGVFEVVESLFNALHRKNHYTNIIQSSLPSWNDIATIFIPTENYTPTKLRIPVSRGSDSTDDTTISVKLIGELNGKPDSNNIIAMGESKNTKDISDIYSWVEFSLTNPTELVANTPYYIVISKNVGTNSAILYNDHIDNNE